MQRPERLIALALGSLMGHQGLVFALVLLAVTTNYTVVERLRSYSQQAEIWSQFTCLSPAVLIRG